MQRKLADWSSLNSLKRDVLMKKCNVLQDKGKAKVGFRLMKGLKVRLEHSKIPCIA